MATFFRYSESARHRTPYKFYFVNHSSQAVSVHADTTFREVPEHSLVWVDGPKDNVVGPGTQTVWSFNLSMIGNGTIESGNAILCVLGFSCVQVRFWSGGVDSNLRRYQYINLLALSGFSVTQDREEFNEIVGNGLRVTVDGGGHDRDTENIFVQFYDR